MIQIMGGSMKTFFTYILVLVGIYIAQTGFKIASTWKTGKFDWKKLIDGIIEHLIRLIAIIVFFYAGYLINDVQIIPLGDKILTIDDALIVLAYSLIAIRAVKLFTNIKEVYEIDDDTVSKTVSEPVKELG